MKISDKTKNELKRLKENTTFLIENKELYQEIFSLLQSDLDFLRDTQLHFTDKKHVPEFDIDRNILTLKPLEAYYYSKRIAYTWINEIKKEELEDLTKDVIFITMLHEVTHGEQSACLRESYSPYEEINRLYRILEHGNCNPLRYINYSLRATKFSFERNANINAYIEFMSIANSSFVPLFKETLTSFYLDGYNYDKKVKAPALQTLHMIGKRYNIKSDGIPLSVLLEHGLILSPQDYNDAIIPVDHEKDTEKAYALCLEKLERN